MVLESIYVVRHGVSIVFVSARSGTAFAPNNAALLTVQLTQFRMNWAVDPTTGKYLSNVPTPTGIPSDPALASYGERQSEQLAKHLETLDPPIDAIYSSPFYRCLQTIRPFLEGDAWKSGQTGGGKVRCENGLGEWYGLARFEHPSPASLDRLHTHFPNLLDPVYKVVCVPSANGESLTALHDRVAYAMHRVIEQADKEGIKTLLICTHAATMICIGRVLSGRMPEDPNEEDFRCFTCSFSSYARKSSSGTNEQTAPTVPMWQSAHPDKIPTIEWRGGSGVAGGWSCTANGVCDFLEGGEERGW